MICKVRGEKTRPRVALLGGFEAPDREAYHRMFPTIWEGEKIAILEAQVDPREVDLLVIGEAVDAVGNWPRECHLICFSTSIGALPGPIEYSTVVLSHGATNRAFGLPELPLPLYRLREADLADLDGVRGWHRLEFCDNPSHQSIQESKNRRVRAEALLNDGAIVVERETNTPLAFILVRLNQKLGLAWLPNARFRRPAWVQAIAAQWSELDPEAFPKLGDWQMLPDWMTPDELRVVDEIENLERERDKTLAEYSKRIADLTTELEQVKREINQGRRRLLTEQGDPLVDEVVAVLEELGFEVVKVDQTLGERQPKREDLRIRDPRDPSGWEAIAEVRGYSRSSGKASDLQRLARFAELYQLETEHFPITRMYIVNGQTQLPPANRDKPLASCPEDVEVFSRAGGLVIWTVDLFRALSRLDASLLPSLKETLKSSTGFWDYSAILGQP